MAGHSATDQAGAVRRKFITPATWDEWERSCKGKVKHKTEALAVTEEARRTKIERGKPHRHYQCPFCSHWHVAHDRRFVVNPIDRTPKG